MTMTLPVAQMRIVRDIREAEQALDTALIRYSELFGTLVAARQETGSAPFTGHEALLRLAKSQQALLDAGGDLARVHGALLDIQREMGIADECPPEEKTTGLVQPVAG